MKRGAENQLTKDGPDVDDDDIEEIQDPQGFQKADDATLTKRQIRALPKRALATSRPPALNGLPTSDGDKAETPPNPKFGAFAGFGAGSSAFTFTTQQPPSSSTLSSILAPPLFGASSKQFPSDSDVSTGSSPPAEETDPVALKYFKSLRGLNVSFLSVISAAVETDPFCDVASLVDSYKNLRTTIQSEFDGTSRSSAPVTTNSSPLFGAKAPSEKTTSLFSMPKFSVASTEASFKPLPTTDNGSKSTGFTFPPFLPPSPAQQPFGSASKSSESPIPLSTPPAEPLNSAFKLTASSTFPVTWPTPFTPCFPGKSTASSSTKNTAAKPASGSSSQEVDGPSTTSSSQPIPISTTPSFGSNSTPNIFSTTKSTDTLVTSDAPSKPMSVFGSSIFGSSGTTDASKPSVFNPSPPDSKESSKASTPLFGSATTVSSTASTNIFESSDKPVSVFGSATQPKTGSFTFGKPAGSIGNPVGFGFGSPSSGASDGSSNAGFSFGASSPKPTESLFSPPMTDKSSESTPHPEAEPSEEGGEEDTPKLLPSRAHDNEGEGEEDEETIHAVKCKLFRLAKKEDSNEWKDLGIGMFRLKKHKETNVRRVLMRNSSTGRILINFRIFSGLKPVLAKSVVSFIGYDNSTPTSFRIRVKTEEQAIELKQAMEREVEAVHAEN